MTIESELAELKDALSKTQTRLEGLGSLQIAMCIALDDVAPGFEQALSEKLNLLYRLAKDTGEDANASMIMTITHQLDQQFRLKAND